MADLWADKYEADLGTLPEEQGWLIQDTGGSTVPYVASGVLYQGPTSYENYQLWQSNCAMLDFTTDGLVFEAELKVCLVELRDSSMGRRPLAHRLRADGRRWRRAPLGTRYRQHGSTTRHVESHGHATGQRTVRSVRHDRRIPRLSSRDRRGVSAKCTSTESSERRFR